VYIVLNVLLLDFSNKKSLVGIISLLLQVESIANSFSDLKINTIINSFIKTGSTFNNILKKLDCLIVSLLLLLLVPLFILFFMLLLNLFFIIYFIVMVITIWQVGVLLIAELPAEFKLDGASCKLVIYLISLYLVPPVGVVILLSALYRVGSIFNFLLYIVLTYIVKARNPRKVSMVLIANAKHGVVAKLSPRV
jgi:hypothetical protein